MKNLLAIEALAQIPKILTLQDRNPHSATYGCFDRNFWHYKTIDFPCGMSQEFVWPLALAYDANLPGNPFYANATVREWTAAGILYAARSAHGDGSCDDYFPFEKAGGAAAFSLLAALESYRSLGFSDEEMLIFFRKRASWLARHCESGHLTNHQALIALCLERAGRLLGTAEWDAEKDRRLQRVLDWQDSEGWFQEYEGADPGYQTLTIGLLAQLYEVDPSPRLKVAIEEAVRFAAQFMHPDGSFGGEYSSRNTYNYFPHGFELVGRWMPEALEPNDRFLAGLARGLNACYADDHIIGHHTWSYLLAWKHYADVRPPVASRPKGRTRFPKAGLLIDRRDGAELYIALNKGGVFRFFRDGELVASDTQLSFELTNRGKRRQAVAHLVSEYLAEVRDMSIHVAGSFGWAKCKEMTPLRLVCLRVFMLVVGRCFPNLVRSVLQKLLITGKAVAPLTFERTFIWEGGRLRVRDVVSAKSWAVIQSAGLGGAQTSIYVAASRTFQRSQLHAWIDLTSKVRQLKQSQLFEYERIL